MRVPSMDEIWEVSESRGANSEAPHLWDGLVGAWPMQEGGGSQIYDVSQYRNNGTMVNMALTSWRSQQYGRGLMYDGIDDSVSVPYSSILTPTKQLTLSVFASAVQGSLADANRHLINKSYTTHVDPYYSYALSVRDNSSIGMPKTVTFFLSPGSVFTYLNVPNVVVYDRVQHYAATYDGSFMRVFVDGALKGSLAASGDIPNFNTELLFAKIRNYTSYFNGVMSDVRIWNRALSPNELAQVYADPWAMYRVRPRVLVRGVTLKKTPIHHLVAGCT
jgi:hypothetical protein